jgi:glycosyltransferase involved in cell wall biosynthesis
MPKVTLSMIVRNEAHCIERCLNSVKWLVDSYKIVDTGSTDDTVAIISRVMGDIPGIILMEPWRDDFAYSRNLAIPKVGELGLEPGDYWLLADADDEMVVGMPFLKDALVDPIYGIGNVENEMTNFRAHLVRMDQDVCWKYVRHEVLDRLGTVSLLRPEQIKIQIHHEGARSKDPNKGINDALAILKDMPNWPKDSSEYRYYTFLVGCCYIDCRIYDKASDFFRKYLKMAGEDDNLENIWMANHLLAVCAAMERKPANEVVEAYMAAINADPERLESYFLLARYLIDHNCLQSAKMIAGLTLKMQKKVYILKHMSTWWDLREKFYQELCETIVEGSK